MLDALIQLKASGEKLIESQKEILNPTPPEKKTEEKTVTPTPEAPKTEVSKEEPQQTVTPIAQTEISDEEFQKQASKRGWKKADDIPETEDEKKARLQQEEKDFTSYAVSQLGMKPEDLAKPSFLKQKQKIDLVYEEYAENLKDIDKNISDAQIKRKFNAEYGIVDIDESDETNLTEDEITQLKAERELGLKAINKRADKIISKSEVPIGNAKSNFEQYKKNEAIIRKYESEVDIFAKQLGEEFIYEDEDGKVPIELSPEYKNQLIENLRVWRVNAALNNPNGSFDLQAVASNQMRFDLQKQILGVIKSNAYNKGKADAKIGVKNPMTEANAGALPNTDAEKKKADTINAATDIRTKMANSRG